MVPAGHLFPNNKPLCTVENETYENTAMDPSFSAFHPTSNQERTLTENSSFECDSQNTHFLQDIRKTCERSLHPNCSFQQEHLLTKASNCSIDSDHSFLKNEEQNNSPSQILKNHLKRPSPSVADKPLFKFLHEQTPHETLNVSNQSFNRSEEGSKQVLHICETTIRCNSPFLEKKSCRTSHETEALTCSDTNRLKTQTTSPIPTCHTLENDSSEAKNTNSLYDISQHTTFASHYPLTASTSIDVISLGNKNSIAGRNFEESRCHTVSDEFRVHVEQTGDTTCQINNSALLKQMVACSDKADDKKLLSNCNESSHVPYQHILPPSCNTSSVVNVYDACRSSYEESSNPTVTFPPHPFPTNSLLDFNEYMYQSYGPSFSLAAQDALKNTVLKSDVHCHESPTLTESHPSSTCLPYVLDSFHDSKHLIDRHERTKDASSLLQCDSNKTFKASCGPNKFFSLPMNENVCSWSNKRPRGRPRKYPLNDMSKKSLEDEMSSLDATAHPTNALEENTTVSFKTKLDSLHSCNEALGQKSSSQFDSSLFSFSKHLYKKAFRCLQSLRDLQHTACSESLQQLEAFPSQDDISEEYVALGGPFTNLAIALSIQEEHSLLLKPTQFQTCQDASSTILQRFKHSIQQLAVNLTASFVWSSFDSRIPVRDIAASRYHLIALLNDSRVFVYRHKTHPLVTSRVNEWEHVEILDNCAIVSVRIASANLPEDWREKYHSIKRLEIIKSIRQKLQLNNIAFPSNVTISSNDITMEELRFFIEHDPQGILCCPTASFNPDWLPDPFVIAALDRCGTVRIAKCFGFFNYPIVQKVAVNSPLHNLTPLQGHPTLPNTTLNQDSYNNNNYFIPFLSQPFPNSLLNDTDINVYSDGFENFSYSIIKNLVAVNHLEKQIKLSVPLEKLDEHGDTQKVVAEVQEIALAELTEDSLLCSEGSSPEVAMILYALAKDEHSAFVKGKNLYIRFKNFPTGPTKIYCGPLGHCGSVLLADGTVWMWTAKEKLNGSSEDKLGVLIYQVQGSLQKKVVIDVVGIGADFLALTTDGVVHEWNCYDPYISKRLKDTTIPQSVFRPKIPEPIELTPTFQKKLLERRVIHDFIYKIGTFSSGDPQASHLTSSQTQPDSVDTCTVSEPSLSTFDYDLMHSSGFQKKEQNLNTTGPQKSNENTDVSNNVNNATKENFFDAFLPPPLPSETRNYLLCEKKKLSSRNENKSIDDNSYMKENNWDLTDYTSEAILEKRRQYEIKNRYLKVQDIQRNTPDLIERIFLMEGVTFFLRGSSCQYSYILNDLGSYRSGKYERWRDVFSSGENKIFNKNHAECFLRTFNHLGKPLSTNPVVLARLKLKTTENHIDQQLREELRTMADARPPTYRVVCSPTSLLVGILRRFNFTAEARQRIFQPLPVLVAAHNPNLYVEAFSGVRLEGFHLPLLSKTSLSPTTSFNNDMGSMYYNDSDDGDDQGSIMTGRKIMQRRGRGRVGRPRGSRSSQRTSLSSQRQRGSHSNKILTNNVIDSSKDITRGDALSLAEPTPELRKKHRNESDSHVDDVQPQFLSTKFPTNEKKTE
ncbi:uncharacterized protein LOC128883477 [Hylaeus volcanicus]|uniref:uncharacterized protein LOC128883477 n=1 Tax=Hylaeus volcanicus TaxID=313075 RepID=UPI0023B79E2B|nr:uncharacterized protein LOC128883477 [Hylaeus volcanicus]